MDDSMFEQFSNDSLYEYKKAVNKEIEKASDRGTVLICASVIEELLKDLLEVILIKSDKIENDLFKGNGPLSTFDARKKMLYYLGIVTKEDYDNLTYIQRVRNKFAHNIIDATFKNQDIINICTNFELTKDAYAPDNIPFPDNETGELPKVDLNPIKEQTSAHDKFVIIFNHLFNVLIYYMMRNVDTGMIENTKNKTAVERLEDMMELNNIRTEKYSELIKEEKEKLEQVLTELEEGNIDKKKLQNKTELISQIRHKLYENKESENKNCETEQLFRVLNQTLEYAIKVYKNSLK